MQWLIEVDTEDFWGMTCIRSVCSALSESDFNTEVAADGWRIRA